MPAMKRFTPPSPGARPKAVGHGLARVLSKLGHCSRSEGERLVRAGRVCLNGTPVLDPEHRTDPARHRITVDGRAVEPVPLVYLMLNKPRGLVTTRDDPQGRETVYACLDELDLPHVAPVGRLDQASEGLLLFTNDTLWANAVLEGEGAPSKTYHVKIDAPADEALLAALRAGVEDKGERLIARSVRSLRPGLKQSWLEVVLDEGRNRHIRRMLGVHGLETLRLVRVGIGPLALGTLPKGSVRALERHEIEGLALPASPLRKTVPPEGSAAQSAPSKAGRSFPKS